MNEDGMILVECAWDERPDVAAWLIATADDKGIDRKLIQTRNTGFLVPPALLVEPEMFVIETVPGTSQDLPVVAVAEPVLVEAEVEPDRETVRAWAKENGIEVAEVGRLKKSVYEAYAAR